MHRVCYERVGRLLRAEDGGGINVSSWRLIRVQTLPLSTVQLKEEGATLKIAVPFIAPHLPHARRRVSDAFTTLLSEWICQPTDPGACLVLTVRGQTGMSW